MLMFSARAGPILTDMTEADPSAELVSSRGNDLVTRTTLPTGTVTLLLADIEGSTRLWQSQPSELTTAIALLDCAVSQAIADHNGVRPVEQGEGDSFVIAFARASDAIACALELQRVAPMPIRLRIGLHTGDVQLRDDGNYIGPTINRTARLRDLAHGGQTVLSGTTSDVVIDALPADASLIDLGVHPLRDLPRPERVLQLCHPELPNTFPPLRTTNTAAVLNLPVQLTSFVGRRTEIADVARLVADGRLITLTGAGGVGKTRLAIQVAEQVAGTFPDGVWFVDLAPITDPDIVPTVTARALGLPDQPGNSTLEALTRFVGARRTLMVVDNCEHLIEVCAELVETLVGSCSGLTLLATSREPLAVAGEVTWQVPSLPVADEAIELFTERARLVRPEFTVDADIATVGELCRRLDGIPLAIELAAARVRSLSLNEIRDSLHNRFRLLTGGARTAVRRQQTLRASVDWSHALLTEPERILFRRLAAFMGGFDLDAARAVTGGGDIATHQVVDLLTLLVEKSLVVTEVTGSRTRYQLLETVRQYAQEKLGESGEADAVRACHRDHYTAMATRLDAAGRASNAQLLAQADIEIDNLRAAFAWSRDQSETELALVLASALQRLWMGRGRIGEGASWFDAVLTDTDDDAGISTAVQARALADKALLDAWMGKWGIEHSVERAQHALDLARTVDDQALLARALIARCYTSGFLSADGRPHFIEAMDLVRALGDEWTLSHMLTWEGLGGFVAGDPVAVREAAAEGRDIADAIGNPFDSRMCRFYLGWAQLWCGDLTAAIEQLGQVAAEADACADVVVKTIALECQAQALAYHGDVAAARSVATEAVQAAAQAGGIYPGVAYCALAHAALAAGDIAAAAEASQAGWPIMSQQPDVAATFMSPMVQAALSRGDLSTARRLADDAVGATNGWHKMVALTMRARVARAQGQAGQAERDARAALVCGTAVQAHLGISDAIECLAVSAAETGSYAEAVRLFAAAAAMRHRMSEVRFQIYQADYDASIAALRNDLGENDFASGWAEGAALSAPEAIVYAQRGHGERKRPAKGWASLTPAEHDVVQLAAGGLSNSAIAAKLFVSPRTVQTHISHVYAKLGLTSRIQLAQEAARHA